MTKKEIIAGASEISGVSQQIVRECFEAVLLTMSEAMNGGHSIVISGFGKFVVKEYAEKCIKHPTSGELYTIPCREIVKFKASPNLLKKNN